MGIVRKSVVGDCCVFHVNVVSRVGIFIMLSMFMSSSVVEMSSEAAIVAVPGFKLSRVDLSSPSPKFKDVTVLGTHRESSLGSVGLSQFDEAPETLPDDMVADGAMRSLTRGMTDDAPGMLLITPDPSDLTTPSTPASALTVFGSKTSCA